MPKFSSAERTLVKSIVATLLIRRFPEKEIIDEIYSQTNKTLTKAGLFYVKQAIKKESFKWYKTMREGQYEYIYQFKERIDEILWLQKKHHEIIDNPIESTRDKLDALTELHRLNITLSNYFDVAPSIINDVTLSAPQQINSETTRQAERDSIIV